MKITDIIKFEKPQLSFSDLDAKYQNHFFKQFALTITLGISLSIFLALLKQYEGLIGCILICLAYCAYTAYQIYRSLTNHVIILDAECINVEKKETNLLGLKGARTCNITLKTTNDQKITQTVPYLAVYKTGDTIRIYANEGSISQLNNNTYTVINPIFMHVLSS